STFSLSFCRVISNLLHDTSLNQTPTITNKSLGEEENCAAIRANFPIPEQCGLFYFEVDIIDKGENGYVGDWNRVCTKSASLNKMPGWEDSSWGYHGDDGNIFFNASRGKPYGKEFMTGDTIGCCLNIRNNMIFYTRNGVLHSDI
ncbi:11717_t:CDS:2, partial [Funneliformis geosporum]